GRSFRVQLFVAGDAILVARGRLTPARQIATDDAAIRTIQRVNEALGLGAVGVWRDQPQPYHQVAIPLAWVDVSPALVRGIIDDTAAVMEIVDRLFPGASSAKS